MRLLPILFLCFSCLFITNLAQGESVAEPELQEITVYRSPTCECCEKWMAHLEENGFTVKDKFSMNLVAIKDQVGIPRNVTSCHTAFVGDYIIEGHVPAQDIKRLLLEKPAVNGLSVPKMPIGSPGMEVGDRRDPYTVFTFEQDGKLGVFNRYNIVNE